MVLSGKPRLIVRKSLSMINCQVAKYKQAGDQIIVAASSSELKKFGWKYGLSNIPASYLTGYLCGLKAKSKGVKEIILDIGLYRPTKGAKIFAAAKGAADAGLGMKIGEEILPAQDRIAGKHIADYAQKVKAGEKSNNFSICFKSGNDPSLIVQNFEEVKRNMAQVK